MIVIKDTCIWEWEKLFSFQHLNVVFYLKPHTHLSGSKVGMDSYIQAKGWTLNLGYVAINEITINKI